VPEVQRTLAEGETATLPLAAGDLRANIVINPPASRDLPDAATTGCQATSARSCSTASRDNANLALGEPHPYDQHNYRGSHGSYPEATLSPTARARAWSRIRSLDVPRAGPP